jgi:hypothetical protein
MLSADVLVPRLSGVQRTGTKGAGSTRRGAKTRQARKQSVKARLESCRGSHSAFFPGACSTVGSAQEIPWLVP